MKTVTLPSGEPVPALGQGTWRMGEHPEQYRAETDALRGGLDAGLNLIDTAEMYGEGGAESVVGNAIQGRRDEVFLVSKVYPHNATATGTVAACERSLKRLQTDRIDLYLLHWRGTVPLADTMEAFNRLQNTGKIRYFGVSNFDTADMQEWCALVSADATAANQILYNLSRRGSEYELLPWCSARRIPIMAYTPLQPARGRTARALRNVAARYEATLAQVALAWLLHRPGVMVIPKAASGTHVDENRAALDLHLNADDLSELDVAFPPPVDATPLEMG